MRRVLWSLAAIVLLNIVSGGSEYDYLVPRGIAHRHRVTRGAVNGAVFADLNQDQIFDKFFTSASYLLKPEDLEGTEDDEEEATPANTSLSTEEDDDYDEDDDAGRSVLGTLGSVGKQVIKTIGKIGLNLLKRGLKFLKSTFYKFGGKRLLRRAKKYLKEDAFTLEPLSCEGASCSSCAVMTLPFKIKKFKACAEIGFVRERGLTNFTVDLNVVKHSLFNRHFPVGDIANCYQFGQEVDGTATLASMIGKVCVQGFEFSIKTDKTGKFCLALVFKRWAVGYRFCIERAIKKDPCEDEKKKKNQKGLARQDDKKNTDCGTDDKGKKPVNRGPKHQAKGKIQDKRGRTWKVTLKTISAGEQDNQIVSDTPLFKGEAKTRKEQSEALLQGIEE